MRLNVLVMRMLQVMGQMRTAVVLLGICALASMSGTLLVQGLPIQDYVIKFGPLWARVFWYTGLTDVFRAWWFIVILAVLLTSVSVCVLRNGPLIYRQMFVPKRVPKGRQVGAVEEDRLKALGFRCVGEVDGAVVWQRGVMNRVGYFAVHIGVLGVAVASLLTGFVGWRGSLNLREGEADNVVLVWRGVQAMPHFLPFAVKNDGFEIEQYPTGMPKRYSTRLRFSGKGSEERGGEVAKKEAVRVVEVNKPVRWGAYAFYQASFGDGGSSVKGRGINLADGAMVPFEGHIYDKAMLADGTRVELLDFRPFTVETFAGERPTDVGPSMDYLVQPPDAEAMQLRAFVNHPDIVGVADGQKVGGANDGAVIYRPVQIGLQDYRIIGLQPEVWWRMVAQVAGGADLKAVAGPVLAKIKDEQVRVATGLQLLQAARTVKELHLSHVIVLDDFKLRRYSGLQVAYDPGATLFWLMAALLILGVVLMLGRRFARVWVKDGVAQVTSPQGGRVVREVVAELEG